MADGACKLRGPRSAAQFPAAGGRQAGLARDLLSQGGPIGLRPDGHLRLRLPASPAAAPSLGTPDQCPAGETGPSTPPAASGRNPLAFLPRESRAMKALFPLAVLALAAHCTAVSGPELSSLQTLAVPSSSVRASWGARLRAHRRVAVAGAAPEPPAEGRLDTELLWRALELPWPRGGGFPGQAALSSPGN